MDFIEIAERKASKSIERRAFELVKRLGTFFENKGYYTVPGKSQSYLDICSNYELDCSCCGEKLKVIPLEDVDYLNILHSDLTEIIKKKELSPSELSDLFFGYLFGKIVVQGKISYQNYETFELNPPELQFTASPERLWVLELEDIFYRDKLKAETEEAIANEGRAIGLEIVVIK